ncbi:MAG: hypothetical protein IJ966_03370 [Bacilli bacterium]|nr:hypothetical protein [Bacilli bacterium]
MKKVYFRYQPDCYQIYDDINREGECTFRTCDKFAMSDPADNVMIFEGKSWRLFKRTIYSSKVREFFTGEKFNMEIKKPKTEKGKVSVMFYSKKLGLYPENATEVPFAHSVLKNAAVSGFFKYLKSDASLFKKYINELNKFFDTAYKAGEDYAKVIDGPTKSDAKALRKSARQVNR